MTLALAAPITAAVACGVASSGDAPKSPAEADGGRCAPIPIDGSHIEDGGCGQFRLMPCGLPDGSSLDQCFPGLDLCEATCGTDLLYYCLLAPVTCTVDSGIFPDAAVILECVSCAGPSGRRPRGLSAPRLSKQSPIGDYFASMAHLESASVRAFRDLEGSLASLGAPRRLTRAARRAAEDERLHARAAARLARRFDGTPPRPCVRRAPPPSLFELLEDDAIEGCVGETFGALLAMWQADHASDARVRRTMLRIAEDETRHAALAWEIFEWGLERLNAPERMRVRRTLDGALVALEKKASPVDAATRRIAGYPPIDVERRLVRELARLVRAEASVV